MFYLHGDKFEAAVPILLSNRDKAVPILGILPEHAEAGRTWSSSCTVSPESAWASTAAIPLVMWLSLSPRSLTLPSSSKSTVNQTCTTRKLPRAFKDSNCPSSPIARKRSRHEA